MKHIVEYLQDLDTAVAFFVICPSMMLLVAAMPLLRARLLGLQVGKPVSDGASDAFKAVAGFMVFVVGFSLIQVQGQYRQTEDLALREANVVSTLDRALFHFNSAAAQAARLDLQGYVKSVIEDEWPLLAHSHRSPKTDALYRKFGTDVRLIEAENRRQQAAEGEMLRALDDMADMREARIAAADLGLLSLYWWVMTGLFTILLVLAFCCAPSADRMMANCGVICAVGILLTLVLVYEDPFDGEISVPPAALQRVLVQMNQR